MTTPIPPPLRIAVLGTGLMGAPMARRLCEAGHQVQVGREEEACDHGHRCRRYSARSRGRNASKDLSNGRTNSSSPEPPHA